MTSSENSYYQQIILWNIECIHVFIIQVNPWKFILMNLWKIEISQILATQEFDYSLACDNLMMNELISWKNVVSEDLWEHKSL